MQFDHSFAVPVSVDEAWHLLLDVGRSGPCVPGAVIESVEGDRVTGTVKVKLGPLNLAYAGTATVVEKDEAARRIVLDGEGHDARTDSTATMTITATLSGSGTTTTAALRSEVEVTGKPGQFGHKVMDDVGTKMVAQFAEALRHVIDGTAVPAKAAKKTATRKSAAKSAAKKAARKAAKTAVAKKAAAKASPAKTAKTAAVDKPVAKKAAAKKATSASVRAPAPAQATEAAPSFAAPGGIPPAPTLEDQPSINGHTGGGPGTSPAQHSNPATKPLQAAFRVTVQRAAPILGPAVVGLVIVLVVQRRRKGRS